jgi:osmoprotectant transport system substrate-binding protein
VNRRLGPRRLATAMAAAAVGVLAGCGSTGLLGHRGTMTTETSLESAAPVTTTTAASVTTIVTTTINGTTTTLDQPGLGRPTILLGDMNTPEQFIVGALYEDALEAQGYTVQLNRNIGPTSVSEAALAQGSLDIYPEYLNVYNTQVAGDTRRYGSLAQAYRAAQLWAGAHGETLLRPTPFADTAGIAVLSSYARIHHLRDLADLRRVEDDLTLGSPLEFSAEPTGLDSLEAAYQFTPAVTTAINIGSQYDGLAIGTLQASYVQTTDWQLSGPLYSTLADSKHLLGFGNVVPVVSEKVLVQEGPAFARAINQVDALLSMSAIRGLAAEMRASTDPAMSATDVAQEFLQGYDIGPPPPWATLTATTTTTTTTPITTTAAATAPATSLTATGP